GRVAGWSAEQSVSVDQRGFRIGPLAGLAAEVNAQILLPAHLAGAALEAGQVAIGAERVKQFTLHRRRGAGRRKARLLLGVPHLAEAGGPNSFAVLDGEGLHEDRKSTRLN